jgi:DNA-binding CsgD family transcriptional regulator
METLIADGLSDKEISQRLGLSRSTVTTYLGRVSRYGLRNRAQAVARFPRVGLYASLTDRSPPIGPSQR